MGGLGVVVVLGLYVLIAYKVIEAANGKWIKVTALVAAFVIPSADAIYGRIKLKSMCEAESGLKVYRVAEHVEGFMDDDWSGVDWDGDYRIKRYSFQFIEGRMYQNTTSRISLQPDGRIATEKSVLPKSQYRLQRIYPDTKATYNKDGFAIEEMSTGEILARYERISFNGGWAERLIALFSDAGEGGVTMCPDSLNAREAIDKLINSTLKH